jgi:elongation factor 1 alpha-like protein
MSKLAALAAARKKREGEKEAPPPPPAAAGEESEASSIETKSTPLSLRERLAGNGKPQKAAEGASSLRSLGKSSRPRSLQKKPSSPEPIKPDSQPKEKEEDQITKQHSPTGDEEHTFSTVNNIRAPPSTFASIIVGDTTRPTMTEPSHLQSNTVDLIKIYGQDLTEPFDFAGPSPDDVVINAQNSAKGLAIRRKCETPA